ncbi:GTPase Der [Bienertia sinuspersici]
MQDPLYWTYRPFTKQMVQTAADDVRFLPYVYYRVMEQLNEQSLWKLAVRGVLHCRCSALITMDADWPPLPSAPDAFLLVEKFLSLRYYQWLMFRLGKWDTLLERRELQSNI